MIKILHLITDLETGGAEMMLSKLVQNMDKSQFDNVVVSMTNEGILGKGMKESGIPVLCLGMKRGNISPKYLLKLFRIIKQENPDIIQTWLYHSDLMGALCARILRIPVIWNIRCADMVLSMYSKLTALIVKVCASISRVPDAVVVNSESGKGFHKSIGYRPRRWEFIPNGFELNRFTPDRSVCARVRNELGISEASLLIGIVARNDPMKDLDNFVESANIIINRTAREIYFLMVGRGIDYDNHQLTRQIGRNSPYFFLAGERSGIAELMASLDIYCSSSLSEGFPNVIGEAMASGVPCVVTDAGDSALIVGDCGTVVPVKNPQALAGALLDFINMPEDERRELGRRARQRIELNYSLAAVVSMYEVLYKEIVDNVRN